MTVIYKKPGEAPEQIEVENELAPLQSLVDGYIEHVYLFPLQIGALCNEEGRLLGMPYNCTICGIDFYGPVVLLGHTLEDFDNCPYDLDEIEEIYPEFFIPPYGGEF